MQIIDNKAVLLTVRNPDQITAAIPKSKKLSDNQVVVSWGLDEMQVLRNLQIKDVPSPILGRYAWPGQLTPYDHQKSTSAFLTLHRRAFCFNEQGTGKTGSVIWAADYLMSIGAVRRVLIACPVSIMDSAWRADLFKVAMHRTVDIAYGTRTKRQAVINSPAEFVVINYAGIEIVADDIANGKFDLIVVDEANAYKNAQTKRWKVLAKLIKPDTWLWMLTGTPAAQSPMDAYGIAKLVNPQGVPRFFTSFKEQVMLKVTNFKWIPKSSSSQTVFDALQPAIRYTKAECLDLPPMTYVRRSVELTKQQQKYYNILKSKMAIKADGEAITSANAAVNLSKLLQISCGAVYSDEGEVLEFDISKRYNVLLEVIEESNNKVLVFVPFKHVISILHTKLTADLITTEVISGDVPAGKRTEIFNAFQTQPDPKVLVIQPNAAAHGVTLTAADTVVWWGPMPSLETYAQANARIDRVGQCNNTTVVQLAGSAVERNVYDMLDKKIDVHNDLISRYSRLIE
jgi:SNF2 family DNA or RNA helicase